MRLLPLALVVTLFSTVCIRFVPAAFVGPNPVLHKSFKINPKSTELLTGRFQGHRIRSATSGVLGARAESYSKEEGFDIDGPRKAGGSTGDLAILGALRSLRSGDLQQTREVWFPGTTNEAFKFQCQKADFFVKINRHFSAKEMFEGEAASLNAMRFGGMRCPAPLRFGDLPDGGSYLITEYMDLDPFALTTAMMQETLGKEVAKMHLHQPERHQFYGFGVPTLLGRKPANNNFCASWSSFFIKQRLEPLLDQALRRFPYKAQKLRMMREELLTKSFQALEDVQDCRPSILHGDLQFSNAGMVEAPYNRFDAVLFDPCSFYGNSEFDLAYEGWPLHDLHSGHRLSDAFFDGYHSVIPRRKGHNRRKEIYQMFHLLKLVAKSGAEHVPLITEMARSFVRG
eukprot:CAMPEP_0181316804 /NCGR_PEP_ID=MMETSP1101-20121128/16091_1 /TAXON_ID=46948 /ORGANISM="Rhodomonas abbreviata, Strain Caron Lab Isolate" /LENGTH=398 /DNA_ID=CAMNT_0023424077 /DNA_START=255 /DNA_END=1451 /DNA_ORIENTATION=-